MSTDGGNTFQLQNNSVTYFTPLKRNQLAISEANNTNVVYAISWADGSWLDYDSYQHLPGVYAYVSTNGGTSFSSLYTLTNDDHGCMPLDFMFVQASSLNSQFAVFGYGTAVHSGVWRTTDCGSTFIQIQTLVGGGGSSTETVDHNNIALSPFNQDQAILCGDQGLQRTNEILVASGAVGWYQLNNTLSFTEAYKVTRSHNDPRKIVLGAWCW